MTEPQAVTLILIEDDPGHQRLAMKAIRRSKLSNPVKLCVHGGEALTLIREFSKDQAKLHVLLLDLNLPVLKGQELLREARQRFSKNELPIVILSTTMNCFELKQCCDAGSSGALTKPLNLSQLTLCLKHLDLDFSVEEEPGGKMTIVRSLPRA